MNMLPFRKASVLAVAVSAALAACGGGGGGDATPAATTTAPPVTGTTTTGTTTSGQTLTANTGSSSGAASNVTGPIQAGLPAIVPVPAANQVVTSVAASTYTGQAVPLFNSINEWRGQMRFEEEGAFGVGLLTQQASLDTLATTLRTSQPDLFSTDPALRAAALAAAQAAMTALGYQTAYVLTSITANSLGVTPGNFCAKSLFSTLPGVELATSGVRDVGLSILETAGDGCIVLTGLTSNAAWQLPPTGSSSVYPFPGKQLTLPNYYGDWASLGFAAQPGHAVLASVVSNDALPVAVTGVGTPIPTSQITVVEFTLKLKSSGAAVPARVFTQAGVVAGAGVTLQSTSLLQFPTSIMLVPEQPLTGASVYTATFRATVRGRTVTRSWDFTTA